jgi:hypothetical protein
VQTRLKESLNLGDLISTIFGDGSSVRAKRQGESLNSTRDVVECEFDGRESFAVAVLFGNCLFFLLPTWSFLLWLLSSL